MANNPDRGAGHSDEPDDWADVFVENPTGSLTTPPPAGSTRPSAQPPARPSVRPPEITGVRTRTPELEAAVTGAYASATNRPIIPSLAEDDPIDGAQTKTMSALTQSELLQLQRNLSDDGRLPPPEGTLPPDGQPQTEGAVRSQGIPGNPNNRSGEEKRVTLPGHGTSSAPRIGRPVDFRARTPALGVCGHPSYRGPIVAEAGAAPEETRDTVKPSRDEYGPTVREFRSDSRRSGIGRPDHQAPPPADEHADADPVVIPYSDVPSAALRALYSNELPHGELFEGPDTDRDVETAFDQIVVNKVSSREVASPPIVVQVPVTGPTPRPATSQRTRRLLLGVATLTLVILAAAIYHLADNWWYYNPF